jgi:hypothetical protein
MQQLATCGTGEREGRKERGEREWKSSEGWGTFILARSIQVAEGGHAAVRGSRGRANRKA